MLESGNRKAALDVAKFYEKTGKVRSAAICYRDVISKYPGSSEAKFAQDRLVSLKQTHGEEALGTDTNAADSPGSAESKKKMQASASNASRSDYVGPQLKNQSQKDAAKRAPEVVVPSASSFRLQAVDTAPPPLDEQAKSAAGSQEKSLLIQPRITPPTPQNP